MEPQDNETTEENVEPQVDETTPESEEKKTDTESVDETKAETQELLKKYREQLAGQTKGFDKVLKRIEDLEAKIAGTNKQPESPPETSLSDEDKPYIDYYKKLGFIAKDDVEKMFQERIAPLTKTQEATQKAEQQRILNDFIQNHPELSKEQDVNGDKMGKVIEKLRRVAPEVPSNPNLSLKDDLETAYNWTFGKSDLEEFRQKAKAAGAAAALEALETQVGGGSSVAAPKKKKTRTPEQEAMLKNFGVDDETISKKKYPNQD